MLFLFVILGLTLFSGCHAAAIDRGLKINAAPSIPDRNAFLNKEDFLFDFFNSEVGISAGKDGRTVAADAKTFPATIGNGVSLSIGILGPCGLNTPHVHPRATEFNLAVNGTLATGDFEENDEEFIMQTLKPGQATVFPQGTIHFEQNLGCDTALFVAAFSDPDPGVLSVAQGFLQQLPAEFVDASLGGIGVQEVKELAKFIPDSVAFGTQECLDRCGITRPH